MSNLPLWAKALQINEGEFSKWLEDLPAPEFVLQWALECEKINEAAYLKWAQGFYQIPLVREDFFQRSPPFELWKKHISGPWSLTCLPLYEWKSTLILGTLEPRNVMVDGLGVQCVLVPLSKQSPWWQSFLTLRREIMGLSAGTASVPTAAPVAPMTTAPTSSSDFRSAPVPPPSSVPPAPEKATVVTSTAIKLGLKLPDEKTGVAAPAAEAKPAVEPPPAPKLRPLSMPTPPSTPPPAATEPAKIEIPKPEPIAEAQGKPEEEVAPATELPNEAEMQSRVSALPPLTGGLSKFGVAKHDAPPAEAAPAAEAAAVAPAAEAAPAIPQPPPAAPASTGLKLKPLSEIMGKKPA